MRTLFRVVDFKTTGIPSENEKHGVCEIGWCDLTLTDGAWNVGEPQAFYVNPGLPVSIGARAVHHIPDAAFADAPPSLDGLRRIMDGMDPTTGCFVAHNAEFEQQFFGGGDVPWICSWKSALRIWPDADAHNNQVLRYFLDLQLDHDTAMPPHRAGPDAYVTAHLMIAILESGADPEQLIRWSKGPALLPRITFGKHKGSRWEDAPADYLRWIADKSDMSRDVKANARHHLKQRERATA